MKKILLAFSTLLSVSLLASCGCNNKDSGGEDEDDKFRITYGRYYLEEEKAELNDITFDTFKQKMIEDGTHKDENFIIATYDKDSTCSCWVNNFGPALKNFVKKYHYEVYTIANQVIPEEDYGLEHYLDQSKPTLALINHGTIVKQFVYNSKSDMFFKADNIKEEVEKFASAPQLFKVSEKYLDDVLFTNPKESALVYYMREKCGDCSFLSPELVWPMAESKILKREMLVMDIDPIKDSDSTTYQEYKDEHLLSVNDNPTAFGYSQGVVPTFQYWEKGVLKDASVFANDSLAKDENEKWYVKQSFYSEERKSHLGYLDGVETTVLEGLEVDSSEVSDWGGWMNKYAVKYHGPLVQAFFDKYAL